MFQFKYRGSLWAYNHMRVLFTSQVEMGAGFVPNCSTFSNSSYKILWEETFRNSFNFSLNYKHLLLKEFVLYFIILLSGLWFSKRNEVVIKRKKGSINSKWILGTSLVVQWLRTRLPMQGTWVRALVQEDPTCRRATKPVRHSYWACALEPVSHNYRAHMPQLLKPTHLEPVLCNKTSHHNEKPAHRN